MMRLPRFSYLQPATLSEAAAMLADAGPAGAVVAGGTDLWPNMKRRQQTPQVVIGLRGLAELHEQTQGAGALLGANLTLSGLLREEGLMRRYPGLRQAISQISTPQLRNMGTLGGNLCLDTRCNYYNQGFEWRQAIDFCMKKEGSVCWVAPGSPRCWAVSSSDTAPVMVALGARLHLQSRAGERVVPAADFFADDGIVYLHKRPDEILRAIELPAEAAGLRSSYHKLRRREAFDFPVLSVAVALRVCGQGASAVVEGGQVVLGAVGSRPVVAADAVAGLIGRQFSDEAIAAAAEAAGRLAKPLDNTDYQLGFRKRLAAKLVAAALREVRG